MAIDEEEGEVHITFMQKCSKTTDNSNGLVLQIVYG